MNTVRDEISGGCLERGGAIADIKLLLIATLGVVWISTSWGQRADVKALAGERQRLVMSIAQEGYAFLKPEYRPTIDQIASGLSTQAKASAALRHEQDVLKEAQDLLKETKTVDGQVRFMGKILDSMMGALISNGTGHGGSVKAAENLITMQPFVDAANEIIRCSKLRVGYLVKITEIDQTVAQASRPAKFPGQESPSPHQPSPYGL